MKCLLLVLLAVPASLACKPINVKKSRPIRVDLTQDIIKRRAALRAAYITEEHIELPQARQHAKYPGYQWGITGDNNDNFWNTGSAFELLNQNGRRVTVATDNDLMVLTKYLPADFADNCANQRNPAPGPRPRVLQGKKKLLISKSIAERLVKAAFPDENIIQKMLINPENNKRIKDVSLTWHCSVQRDLQNQIGAANHVTFNMIVYAYYWSDQIQVDLTEDIRNRRVALLDAGIADRNIELPKAKQTGTFQMSKSGANHKFVNRRELIELTKFLPPNYANDCLNVSKPEAGNAPIYVLEGHAAGLDYRHTGPRQQGYLNDPINKIIDARLIEAITPGFFDKKSGRPDELMLIWQCVVPSEELNSIDAANHIAFNLLNPFES